MRNEKAINNFLSTLDLSLPIGYHFKNAMRDAIVYKWNSATVVAIMKEVEDRYEKIKSKLV